MTTLVLSNFVVKTLVVFARIPIPSKLMTFPCRSRDDEDLLHHFLVCPISSDSSKVDFGHW